jgi:hypothetical protein
VHCRLGVGYLCGQGWVGRVVLGGEVDAVVEVVVEVS